VPREIVIKATCDRCDLRGEESIATRSFVLGLKDLPHVNERVPQTASPAPQKVIEACDTCAKELDDWIDVLDGHGLLVSELIATPHRSSGSRPHRSPAQLRESERVVCSAPDCGKEMTRAGMLYHAESTHKMVVRSQPGKCPDCDYEATVAQAMGNHRSFKHGFDAVADVLARLAMPPATKPSTPRSRSGSGSKASKPS
jgi:hypothetical protein